MAMSHWHMLSFDSLLLFAQMCLYSKMLNQNISLISVILFRYFYSQKVQLSWKDEMQCFRKTVFY